MFVANKKTFPMLVLLFSLLPIQVLCAPADVSLEIDEDEDDEEDDVILTEEQKRDFSDANLLQSEPLKKKYFWPHTPVSHQIIVPYVLVKANYSE